MMIIMYEKVHRLSIAPQHASCHTVSKRKAGKEWEESRFQTEKKRGIARVLGKIIAKWGIGYQDECSDEAAI